MTEKAKEVLLRSNDKNWTKGFKTGQNNKRLTLWVAKLNSHLAESSDQLLVHRLVAVLSEDAEQGLPLVQGLGGLPQATGKTISDQSLYK